MVNNDFSCIEEVTKIVHLTLPSAYNSNEITGICDTLESWKRQYVKQLQGIVVGYKNVSLTSKRGYLKVDCPVIYCNVKATFELFYPVVGSIIKGKVNRISQDHIGCLVHDTINVTVHRTTDISSEISNSIVLDRFILFQITRIVIKPKFIHVKGKITDECVTLMKESSMLKDETETIENNDLNCVSPDFSVNQTINDTATLNSNVQSLSPTAENSIDTLSQTFSSSKKKKHKKSKDKSVMSPSLLSESIESEFKEVESIQFPTTTKKRKRKRSNDDLTLSTQFGLLKNLENESTHAKKKRKRHDSISMKESDPSNDAMDVCGSKFSSMSPDLHSNKNVVTPSNNAQKFSAELESSADLSSQSSSTTKKKKHKKTKNRLLMSPSLLSESLESEMNEIEPTQVLDVTRKRLDSDVQKSYINHEISADVSNQTSSLTKKKKHKKSKDKLMSPSTLSESLESELNEIEPTQPLDVTRKRKRKFSNEVFKSPTHFELLMKVKNDPDPVHPKKKRRIKDSIEPNDKIHFSENNHLSDISPDFPGSGKTGSVTPNNSKENLSIEFKNSIGVFTKVSSSKKKGKHKSKDSSETSPSIFNESVENEIESIPASTLSKKKLKKIKNDSSTSPTLFNELVIKQEKSENGHASPVATSSKKKRKKLDDLPISSTLINESSLNKEKQSKKGKKEKEPRGKNKTHKKKKEKSKERSKKDKKKKSRDKVISTKKKIHGYKVKPKKKSKDKDKKSKKNKSKKEKSKSVP